MLSNVAILNRICPIMRIFHVSWIVLVSDIFICVDFWNSKFTDLFPLYVSAILLFTDFGLPNLHAYLHELYNAYVHSACMYTSYTMTHPHFHIFQAIDVPHLVHKSLTLSLEQGLLKSKDFISEVSQTPRDFWTPPRFQRPLLYTEEESFRRSVFNEGACTYPLRFPKLSF